MVNIKRILAAVFIAVFAVCLCSCGSDTADTGTKTQTAEEEKPVEEKEDDTVNLNISSEKDEDTDGLGDTFSGQPQEFSDTSSEEEEEDEEEEEPSGKDVDLILFMGQSNMSGAGGDASAAPYVAPEAGEEFRAVSDPTRLYPITEPFGINENDPQGLHEYPEAKKGSMVSAFVNKYHELTGRKVIAVSISMGATDMNTWMTPGVTADVKKRFDTAVSYLKNNGYNIGHMYGIWLHGESDAIGGTSPEVYKTALDDIMRPLFIGGVRKVFIITPGRTIDYRDIFLPIINVQKQICADSDYYALATTILTKVSTEYMKDMYHYNQHVLNMVGIEAAKSVAYYTQHTRERIVYDYREGKDIIPDGEDAAEQPPSDRIDLYETNINEQY